MAFNFPNSPTEGQTFTDAASGAQYVYRNGVWMQSSAAQIKLPSGGARNLLVNGSFQVSQENGTTAVTTNGTFPADQWVLSFVGYGGSAQLQYDGKGHNYVGFQNPSARAPAAGDILVLMQPIENLRFFPLRWGGSEAIPAVLNFKARATVAGTYGVSLRDSALGQSIAFDLPITTINEWKEFTLPVPAQQLGTWASGASAGGYLTFANALGTTFKAPSAGAWVAGNYMGGPGMTNPAASGVANIAISDVQLVPDPLGTGAAPPFIAPPFLDELLDCCRYYYKAATGAGAAYITQGYASGAGGAAYGSFEHPVPMRAAPSMTFINTSTSNVSGGAMPVGNVDAFAFRVSISAAAAGTLYCVFAPIGNARM